MGDNIVYSIQWDVVFFDFDGVILDSVDVKTQAFAQMFKQYGSEIENAVVNYHLKNGGVSRYEKFRYYYEQLLNRKISEEQLDVLGEQFSRLVIEKVIASQYIPGALETIKSLSSNNIPMFIVSGTPEDEIRLIVSRKGLSSYFEEVHGSPGEKWKITYDILQRRALSPDKGIFVGDALSDYEAAKVNGLHFLGIVPENSTSIFPYNTKIASEVRL